jgi:arsenical pump membrane protein
MHHVVQALQSTWPPFVLVAGLLLIGHVASGEGVFRVLGSWCGRAPGGARGTFLVTMGAVALVTAVLNLDTSVVFMTPVALQAARAEGADETAFLFGTIFMSNSASLLLPGSNLTNLLVWAHRHASGAQFARHMVGPWIVSIAVTVIVVGVWRWRPLSKSFRPTVSDRSFEFGPGLLAALVAVVAMLALSEPAPWVCGAGVIAEVVALTRRRVALSAALAAINPVTLVALFVVAVVIGAVARATTLSAHLLHHSSVLVTAALAAGVSLIINNLPAASLFSARGVAHPFALLLGLDLGPNIFVTGALSSLLWLRIARQNDARPSILTFGVIGSAIALASLACAVALL